MTDELFEKIIQVCAALALMTGVLMAMGVTFALWQFVLS